MSLILVDTLAWIEFYHPRGSRQVKQSIANALGVHEVAVVAPVMVELLTGARTEGDYRLLNEDLQALEWLPLEVEETQMASKLAYQLARAGQRVPTVDLLIAGVALVHRCELWYFGDAHFAIIAQHSNLSAINLATGTR